MIETSVRLEFIERQLCEFHSFRLELQWYKKLIDHFFVPIGEVSPITVSLCTNYRDTLWHYKKSTEQQGNEDEVYSQYSMMLEHLNRAVIDTLVDLLQKLHHVHREIARGCMSDIEKDKREAIFSAEELKKIKQRFSVTKTGYLEARKALLQLRSKRSSLYRLVSARFDFENDDQYAENSDYYKEAIGHFLASCSQLLSLLQIGSVKQ